MSRTIRYLWTQILLVMCASTLAGCQVTTRTGQYQTWLNWRAVFCPALVYQRSRPDGPPGQCMTSLRQACLINWNDRTFVDPRTLPTRTPPPPPDAAAANGAASSNSAAGATKTTPTDSQSAEAAAPEDSEVEQLPPPAGIDGPELLPKPKLGPSASNASAKAKSSRPGISSPDDIEQTDREKPVGPFRSLWNRVFRRPEEPVDEDEENLEEEESEMNSAASPRGNSRNAVTRPSPSASNRRNQVGRQSVDSSAAAFEVVKPPEGGSADAKPAPAPTFLQRLFGRRPEAKPNVNGNFQRPRPGESAANQPAQVGPNRDTLASAVSARRSAPFGTAALPANESGAAREAGMAQPGAAQPGPVRRFWNKVWAKPPGPQGQTARPQAPRPGVPVAAAETPMETEAAAETEPIAVPQRPRPMTLRALLARPTQGADDATVDAEPAAQTQGAARPRAMSLRALLSRPAPAAESEDPELEDPDRDLDDEDMDDLKPDRRR